MSVIGFTVDNGHDFALTTGLFSIYTLKNIGFYAIIKRKNHTEYVFIRTKESEGD